MMILDVTKEDRVVFMVQEKMKECKGENELEIHIHENKDFVWVASNQILAFQTEKAAGMDVIKHFIYCMKKKPQDGD